MSPDPSPSSGDPVPPRDEAGTGSFALKGGVPRLFRLPRSRLIVARADYDAVYEAGRRWTAPPLVVFLRPAGPHAALPPSRLGITASRKIGSAPRRHRAKRLVREAWRHLWGELPDGWDIVVNCRNDTPESTAEAVAAALRRALERLGAFAPPAAPPGGTEASPDVR